MNIKNNAHTRACKGDCVPTEIMPHHQHSKPFYVVITFKRLMEGINSTIRKAFPNLVNNYKQIINFISFFLCGFLKTIFYQTVFFFIFDEKKNLLNSLKSKHQSHANQIKPTSMNDGCAHDYRSELFMVKYCLFLSFVLCRVF